MKWQEWSRLANNASLWENRQEKGLLKAEYVRDYILRLWFVFISILRVERQRLLTFSWPDSPFRAAVIASFQGDAVIFLMLGRFLRFLSRYGGSLSSFSRCGGFGCPDLIIGTFFVVIDITTQLTI